MKPLFAALKHVPEGMNKVSKYQLKAEKITPKSNVLSAIFHFPLDNTKITITSKIVMKITNKAINGAQIFLVPAYLNITTKEQIKEAILKYDGSNI